MSGGVDNTNTFAVAIKKSNGQTFGFVFDTHRRDDVLKIIGRYAADPDLDFAWYDAALVSQRVRKICSEEREQC